MVTREGRVVPGEGRKSSQLNAACDKLSSIYPKKIPVGRHKRSAGETEGRGWGGNEENLAYFSQNTIVLSSTLRRLPWSGEGGKYEKKGSGQEDLGALDMKIMWLLTGLETSDASREKRVLGKPEKEKVGSGRLGQKGSA